MSTAQGIDYNDLFNRSLAKQVYGAEPYPKGMYYDDDQGFLITTEEDGIRYTQDLVRFSSDCFMLASSAIPAPLPAVARHRQLIGEEDWLHIQFRLGGDGHEVITGQEKFETSDRSCTITRYPANSEIDRVAYETESWRVACLWLKPKAFSSLLNISSKDIPDNFKWLSDNQNSGVFHCALPLDANMALAVNDITSCTFHNGPRLTYMLAKFLELLSSAYQKMIELESNQESPPLKLSEKDFDRIKEAEKIITDDLENTISLAELAKQIGINRTKLILGFRYVYGTSVQAYWRDHRLVIARELLSETGLSVNETAYKVGYSEVSSFTRAFIRKFGIRPKDCKLISSKPNITNN